MSQRQGGQPMGPGQPYHPILGLGVNPWPTHRPWGEVRRLQFRIGRTDYQFWCRPLNRGELEELATYGYWSVLPQALKRTLIWPPYEQVNWPDEPLGLSVRILQELLEQSTLTPAEVQELEQSYNEELIHSQEARISLFLQTFDPSLAGQQLGRLTHRDWVRAWVLGQHRLYLQMPDTQSAQQLIKAILSGPEEGRKGAVGRTKRRPVSPMAEERVQRIDPETGQIMEEQRVVPAPQASWEQLDPQLAGYLRQLVLKSQEAARVRELQRQEQRKARLRSGRQPGPGRNGRNY